MFQALLVKLSEAFLQAKIPYRVIGGLAVLIYGEPRLTKDIEITMGAGIERLKEVQDLVESIGWKVLPSVPIEFVQKTMVLPCLDSNSGVRSDLIFSFSPYEHQAMERVHRITFLGKEVCFASPEDLVIHKVVAGRPRDLEDIRSIQIKNPSIDRNYIEKWLLEFEKTLDMPLLTKWKKL